MSGAPSPEFDAFVDRARGSKVYEVCFDRYSNLKLKKSSEGWAGECPKCGGEDRFGINTKENVWVCRGCSKGGDAIAMVMNAEGLSFIDAVTEIVGEGPPGREAGEPKPMTENQAAEERKEELRAQERQQQTEAEQKRANTLARVKSLWERCQPFPGSPAQRYLRSRKIDLKPSQSIDLRFCPALDYWGFASPDVPDEESLGTYPAMIAAVRDHRGDMIGVHRTYLDAKTFAKLVPPGDRNRNAAKKVFGIQKGGHIRLGPILPNMAMGEGIETTAKWYGLAIGPEDCGIMAGINLGNIVGRSTDSIPHPKFPRRSIPNGVPDMAKPGVILPDGIRSLILLGDGDSDPAFTRMSILTGARRFAAQGVEVSTCFAPDGKDFGDIGLEEGQ